MSWDWPSALLGADVQGPYSTNLLIAGWDEKTGPSLFWMDYLATMHSMNIAGTGYGAPNLCSCIFAQFSAPHEDNMRDPLNALPSEVVLLRAATASHPAFAVQHVCSRLLPRSETLS